MWLNNLQIAIIEKDADKIGDLVKGELSFDTLEEVEKAQYLLAEAAKLIDAMKEETSEVMKKLKKNKEFLEATSDKKNQKLDLRF
jgi:hypothetical protein